MTRRTMHTAAMAAVILICMLSAHTASACTGIRLTGTDGTVVYGRTMEWGAFDWQTTASVTPRGHSFQAGLQDGVDGMDQMHVSVKFLRAKMVEHFGA